MNQKYAIWSLRLGLGIMFLYSGFDIIMHPTAWYWAVRGLPLFIQNSITAIGIDTYLKLQGASELVLAAAFLAWFLPRWITKIAALVAVMEMAAILFLVGVDSITFRDFGLVGAGAALFFLLSQRQASTLY